MEGGVFSSCFVCEVVAEGLSASMGVCNACGPFFNMAEIDLQKTLDSLKLDENSVNLHLLKQTLARQRRFGWLSMTLFPEHSTIYSVWKETLKGVHQFSLIQATCLCCKTFIDYPVYMENKCDWGVSICRKCALLYDPIAWNYIKEELMEDPHKMFTLQMQQERIFTVRAILEFKHAFEEMCEMRHDTLRGKLNLKFLYAYFAANTSKRILWTTYTDSSGENMLMGEYVDDNDDKSIALALEQVAKAETALDESVKNLRNTVTQELKRITGVDGLVIDNDDNLRVGCGDALSLYKHGSVCRVDIRELMFGQSLNHVVVDLDSPMPPSVPELMPVYTTIIKIFSRWSAIESLYEQIKNQI